MSTMKNPLIDSGSIHLHAVSSPYKPIISRQAIVMMSGEFQYLLSAQDIGTVSRIIRGGGYSPLPEGELLSIAVKAITIAYENRRRRLGPPMVCHPLRTSRWTRLHAEGLLAPADIEELCLAAVLHDLQEDCPPQKLSPDASAHLRQFWQALRESAQADRFQRLENRLAALTRRTTGEDYLQYLQRLCLYTEESGELGPLLIKILDRADNTAETAFVWREGISSDFGEVLRELLFAPPEVESLRLIEAGVHNKRSASNAAMLVKQIFKSLLLISCLSPLQLRHPLLDRAVQSLANTCIEESEALVIELFATKFVKRSERLELLYEAHQYCVSGRLMTVTQAIEGADLDGSLRGLWSALKDKDDSAIEALFIEQPRKLCKLMLAFIGVFLAIKSGIYLSGLDHPES